MAAHPTLKEADIRQILSWVLSLGAENKKVKSLPASGSLNPTLNKPIDDDSYLYITAFYTDKGGNNIRPLSGTGTVSLRNSKITYDDGKNIGDGDSLKLVDKVDLNGVRQAVMTVFPGPKAVSAYTLELHIDGANGKKIGEFALAADPGKTAGEKDKVPAKKHTRSAAAKIETPADGKRHTLWLVAKAKDPSVDEDLSLSAVQLLTK